MAWQIILLNAFIFFSSIISLAADINICGKSWEDAPSGAKYQNGKLITYKNDANGNSSVVQFKSENGQVTEYKISKKISGFTEVANVNFQDDILFHSEGKIFHFDSKLKTETELASENGTYINSNLSDPETTVIGLSTQQGYSFFDFKTKEKIVLSNVGQTQVKGQSIVYSKKEQNSNHFTSVSVYDFETKEQKNIDVPKSNYIQFRSDNHIYIQGDNNEASVNLVKKSGHWVKILDSKNKKLSGVFKNGDLMFVGIKHKSGKDIEVNSSNMNDFVMTTEIYDQDQKNKKSSLNGYYLSDYSTGKAILKLDGLAGQLKTSVFTESDFNKILSGESVVPKVTSDDFANISKQGNWAVSKKLSTGNVELTNLNTGKSFKIPSNAANSTITESLDGKNIKIHSQDLLLILDSENGKSRSFENKYGIVFDKNFNKWYLNAGNLKKIENVCLKSSIQVIDDDCNCLFRGAEIVDNSPLGSNADIIKDLALVTMCSDHFDEKSWDKITPPITKGEISKKQAYLYLKRFQKQDGYNSEKHQSILVAILKSDIVEKNPDLINETLKTLSLKSPTEFKKIFTFLNLEKRMPNKFDSSDSNKCKSTSEAGLSSSKIETLKYKSALTDSKTTTADWIEFKPFKSDLQKIPKEQRDAIVDGIGESLSQAAGASPEFNGVFQSKLYYFSKKFALDLVGDQSKMTTDLAVAVRNGQNIPIALGSGDIASASNSQFEDVVNTKNPYGFNFKNFEPLSISESASVGTKIQKNILWQHDGQKFTAETVSTVLPPLGTLISTDKSPDYKKLKPNGKLTGMMVIGSNLSSGHATIVDEYLTYYQNQGFEFKESKTVDAIDFFKKSIQSGEVGYLIKEAHSDGDERNLFRANKSGKLYEGSLKNKNGTSETIYLLAPDAAKHDSKLISNQEFGSWIRDRKPDQPLVYFNASCSSTRKVISEITASHSSNFIPIPSASSVRVFTDTPRSGERAMIQSFREGKSWEEIRNGISKTENFQKGEDHFIFPDEKDYDDKIRQNLKMNIDLEINIKDAAGKEVHIDEGIDH